MTILQTIIALIVGYAFGNIPSGYLYAKSQGVDIYHSGSGNPGSTNVLRTLGKKAGATVLLMDIAKTVVPIFFLHLLWKELPYDQGGLLTLFTGFGVVLGHNYPCIPGLKGGKGVACTGAMLLCFHFGYTLGLLAVFLLICFITRYVSLGSILAMILFFLTMLFFGKSGFFPVSEETYSRVCMLCFLLAAFGVFQHRSNIRRLFNGTENRFGSKKS